MANSKSEQHVIPLNDPNLNRERLKGEIRPWQGFNDRNSPYLSGECLPLYKKNITGLTENSWISPSLDVYNMSSGRLTKNGNSLKDKREVPVILSALPDGTLGGTSECYIVKDADNSGKLFLNGVNITNITYQGYVSDFDDGDIERYFSLNYKKSGFNGLDIIAVNWGSFCHVFLKENNAWVEYKSGHSIRTEFEPGYRKSKFNPPINICTQYNTVMFMVGENSSNFVIFQPNKTWVDRTNSIQVVVNSSNNSVLCQPYNMVMDSFGRYILRGYISNLMLTSTNPVCNTLWTYGKLEVTEPSQGTYNYKIRAVNDLDVLSTDSRPYYQTFDNNTDCLIYNRYGSSCLCGTVKKESSVFFQYRAFMTTIGNFSSNGAPVNAASLQGGQCTTLTNAGLDNNFRLIYEYGQLSAISVVQDSTNSSTMVQSRGTLLTPWASVVDCFVFEDQVGFLSGIDNKWYCLKLDRTVGNNCSFTVYNDRYIILHTANFENAYDTVEDKWLHFADDWNNRTGSIKTMGGSSQASRYVASAVESEFQISGYPFPGYQAPAILSKSPNILETNSTEGYEVPSEVESIDCGYIDFFSSAQIMVEDDGALPFLVPTYKASYYHLEEKRDYEGLEWSIEEQNPLINAPLFTRFQTDLYTMMTIGNTSVLALQVFGKEVLAYYSASTGVSFDYLCCVQTAFYGVTEDGIYSVQIVDGVLSNANKVAQIKGLDYVAYTPLGIIFWNQKNRTAYIFTGDAILKPVDGWSSFSQIKQTKYRPDTQETFWLTNDGLYVGSANYCYRISGSNFTDVFFTDYGFALKEYSSNAYSCTCYAYYSATGHTTLVPLVLETYLYGAGDNIVSTTDCIYIRLYKGDKLATDNATVTVTGHTLTDIATTVEETPKEYTIPISDFDTIDGTYYLRYQPQFQKGLGISIKVTSDVPLIYMGFGNKLETLQITK